MLTRILLVLGPLTLAVGAWRGSPGLAAVGGLWFLLAFAYVAHRRRMQAEIDERRARDRAAGTHDRPAGQLVSTATFLRGTALMLAAGAPAAAVGGWRLGIAEADADWRWLPLVGGGAITALALLATLMFLLGAGVSAAVGPPPTIPADLIIVSMEQTGTYVNNQPRIEFVLDVHPEGLPPYRVTKKATVPFTALGSMVVGKGFRALVAGPEDPTNMDIDWAAPVTGDEPEPSV